MTFLLQCESRLYTCKKGLFVLQSVFCVRSGGIHYIIKLNTNARVHSISDLLLVHIATRKRTWNSVRVYNLVLCSTINKESTHTVYLFSMDVSIVYKGGFISQSPTPVNHDSNGERAHPWIFPKEDYKATTTTTHPPSSLPHVSLEDQTRVDVEKGVRRYCMARSTHTYMCGCEFLGLRLWLWLRLRHPPKT